MGYEALWRTERKQCCSRNGTHPCLVESRRNKWNLSHQCDDLLNCRTLLPRGNTFEMLHRQEFDFESLHLDKNWKLGFVSMAITEVRSSSTCLRILSNMHHPPQALVVSGLHQWSPKLRKNYFIHVMPKHAFAFVIVLSFTKSRLKSSYFSVKLSCSLFHIMLVSFCSEGCGQHYNYSGDYVKSSVYTQ